MSTIPNLAMIVAISENNAIGKDGDLLCHLSADLKHFKDITMGHAIIMGRKTFESLPKGALPGRRNVVITGNPDFEAQGAIVCHSIEEAIGITKDERQRFIIGGAQLYGATIDLIDTFFLTRIHANFPDADTFFPEINLNDWQEIDCEHHDTSDRNPHPYSFITLKKMSQIASEVAENKD